jgi:hypothetical protein
MLFSCKGEKEKTEVLALKEMSELATVEYIVTKIVRADDNQTWYKVGNRKILMSCEASIKAGKAHMISMNIKPEDVRVEYTETGFFRDDFSAAERDALLAQGERQINNSVEALGVLAAAETNASLFISNYLKTLGYDRINIRFSSNTTPVLK